MIVEVIITTDIIDLLKKTENTKRENKFYFNVSNKGVLFIKDKLDNKPLFILKELDLYIVNYVDFYDEDKEDVEAIDVSVINTTNKIHFKEIQEYRSILYINQYNSLLSNLCDYNEPNLEIKQNYEMELWMKNKIVKNPPVKKPQVKGKKKVVEEKPVEPDEIFEFKVCDIKYLYEENKYSVVFIHNDLKFKYIFNTLDNDFRSQKDIFLKLVVGIENDCRNDMFYLYDVKEKTQICKYAYRNDLLDNILKGYFYSKQLIDIDTLEKINLID